MSQKTGQKKTQKKTPSGAKGTHIKKESLTTVQLKTRKNKRLFLERYLVTGNISDSCKQCNIGRQTFYNWIKNDGDFKREFDDTDAALLDFAEGKLLNLINDKNVTAIIFYLKTKGKERGYIEPTYMNIKGSMDHKHTHQMSLNSLKKSYERINGKDKK